VSTAGRAGGAVTRVRTEGPDDALGIRRVHRAAFGRDAEADLVDALRGTDAWFPALSLVAEEDGAVVGHVLLTRARLDTGAPLLALAPVGVLPDRRGRRVGTLLLDEALRRAGETDALAVVVLGHPEYYVRFGFEPAHEFGVRVPFRVPDDAWQLMRLPAWRPVRGTVVYPPAFAAVA
jgi:putative acetyltransferase